MNLRFLIAFSGDHPNQAQLTAQQAADAWPKVEKYSNGKLLVRPSTASHTFHWYDEFFHLCEGCRVDYVATHSYICNVDQTMDYLHNFYRRYGKKVWLTECACPHITEMQTKLEFMQDILSKLLAAHYMFRYSWFSARMKHAHFVTPSASLLNKDSSTLTTLGRFYNNYQGNSHRSQLVGYAAG